MIKVTDELRARVAKLEEGLAIIRDYPPKKSKRRTKDGYPLEFVYDEWAYRRVIDSYREAAITALSPAYGVR